MNASERIELIKNSPKTGEVKSIRYNGKVEQYEIREVPLKALIYNPHNGRIRSLVKSFESSNKRKINPENEDDIYVIEQFLYDSARGKNEKTLESLTDIGQQEIGIITNDGVVIDGNRRSMLLRTINRNYPERNFFKTIVLPDNLKDNEKEIILLETNYQMGVDSKVDYNPIEKYIRCSELKDEHSLSIKEISEIMAETESTINQWLRILELMETYLGYLGTPKIYTRLEKREGHFVDLITYLRTYESKKQNNVNWDYKQEDIVDLRNAYFDYIRLGIPVQRARIIAKPTSGISFFCKKEIWSDFISENKKNKEQFVEEKFSDLRQNYPEKTNEDIIRYLDSEWVTNFETSLIENLSFNEINLKDIIETYTPLKLLKRILNNLGQVKAENVEVTTITEVTDTLNHIDEKIQNLKKILNIE